MIQSSKQIVVVSKNSRPAVSLTKLPPTQTSCDYCRVTFVSLFIYLRHPRDITSHTSRRGTLYYYVSMCFFCTSAFFSLPAADLFSCSRLRGTQGARPDTTAQMWALADVYDTCSWGLKSQVTTGRHSDHAEPSRPMQTHVQVKKNVRRLM